MAKNKIKILYTIPNFDTAGSGRVVYDLVRNLDRSVFEPEICCFHKGGEYFKVIEKLGVKIHIFQFTTPYRPFITFPFRLLKIIIFFRNHQFGLIHSWHWSSDFSEPLAAKISGIPFVYTKKAMGWGNRTWEWRSKFSSKIIAINSDMIPLFFSKKTQKVVEIPLGIDTTFYKPQEKTLATSDGLAFKKNDFVIVSVANLLPIKGIECLVKAVIRLNDEKVKLCLVGNDTGMYAEQLKALVNNNPNIRFVGKKMDVRSYHAMANLFVIPTLGLGEGLPIAPLEAMASERIVIGSNVSGVRDVLKSFPNCIFEPDNLESLKDKIIEMQQLSAKEKIKLQKNMRIVVETHFSKADFISSHEKLYLELVK